MLPIDTSFAFFGISILLALAPGPDNLFVLLHAAVYGRRAGMLVVLGLCSGLLLHTAGVILGLAALFAASTTAYTVLKLCGAAYLVYLAWHAFQAPIGTQNTEPRAPTNARATYARGFLMNISNPKVVIFFLAFLPQFVQPKLGHVGLQMAYLGLLFILATLLTFGTIAVFSGKFGTMLKRSPGIERIMNRTAAGIFVGLALQLALGRH